MLQSQTRTTKNGYKFDLSSKNFKNCVAFMQTVLMPVANEHPLNLSNDIPLMSYENVIDASSVVTNRTQHRNRYSP